MKHDLIKTGDSDSSASIQDRNGEVVLDYCRRCKKGEGELTPNCLAFKPSQVVMAVPPLTGTMGRSEREQAACLVIRGLALTGDEWRPIGQDVLFPALKKEVEENMEPVFSLMRNPFFRPDFHELADGVYAKWTGEPGKSEIEFTEKGLEALSRWVSP